MTDDTDTVPTTLADLFPGRPTASPRFRVEILLNRDGGDGVPDEDQAIAELAAVMLSARGLVTGWMADQSLLSIVVDAGCAAEAIETGAAAVRALGAGRGGARVEVLPA